MQVRLRVFSFIMAATLLMSFSACRNTPDETVDNAAAGEGAVSAPPVESQDPPEQKVEDEDSIPAEQGSALISDTVGNISFSYRDNLTVKDIDGIKYIYYNDTSFFYVESGPLILEDEIFDEEDANEFFASAVQSFNEGDWSNGKIITDINKANFNGLDLWVCEIEMDHASGIKFTSSTAVIYKDDLLTTVNLVSDFDSYQTTAYEFADTLTSIRLA